ncbi:spexin prohormone 1-like [Micropterus salmoides]|uniref:spexin prohormone 1-like n=1 Tax=Micropterus salmoides TaxID=27706 RepID=UPI0018EDDBF3|nr:spexin prohormone 1-like [Micropterus salmoides]
MRCFALFFKSCNSSDRGERSTTHTFKLKLQTAEEQKLTGSAMSLIVSFLVVTLVTQCWSAPQRRNWTPQAILYLKGASGHRSVLERTGREEGDTLHLVTLNQSIDGLGLSLSSILLELLLRAVEEGGGNPESYPELNFNYL